MAHDLREGDAEQDAGLGAGDAGEEVLPAHAGVDDDRHGAEFEQGEGGGDERQALAHHHEHAVTGAHALAGEMGDPGIHFGVEFAEREREVVDAAIGRPAPGNLDRGCVRLAGRHQGQVPGDVGGLAHRGISGGLSYII